MEKRQRQAVLLKLLDDLKASESWGGETHLQKTAYFLEAGLNVPLELRFILYKHGPFSFELREVLGEMRGNYLIDLKPRLPYGPSLIVSSLGYELLQRFPKTVAKYEPEVNFVSNSLGQCSVSRLEQLSTALFVTKENPSRTFMEHAERIHELKPHIPMDLAEESLQKVEGLLQEYNS